MLKAFLTRETALGPIRAGGAPRLPARARRALRRRRAPERGRPPRRRGRVFARRRAGRPPARAGAVCLG